MGEFDNYVALLSDDELESRRHPNMGDMNLGEVIEVLTVVRRDLERGNQLTTHEITESLRNQLGQNFKNQLDSILSQMATYGPDNPNPNEVRLQALTQAKALRDTVFAHLRPVLGTNESQTDLTKLKSEVTDALAELQAQQTALRSGSVSRASSGLSKFYKTEADAHRSTATHFLWGAVASAAVLTAGIIVLFIASPPEYTNNDATEQVIEFVRGTTSRVLLLSIAGFVLAFCVRNYRVNKHLETLNKRRYNALETFGLFQAGVSTDEARNIIVAELVRAVFAHEDTGYLTGNDRTIVESPGGMLPAVVAMSRAKDV